MPDFELIHRPALGTAPMRGSEAFTMKALPEGTVIHILGKPGGDDLAGLLQNAFGAEPNRVRGFGPGQWLVVKDEAMSHEDLQTSCGRLGSQAFAVDQTHGRVRIAVSGHAVAPVLAKGTAVDFEALGVGQSAMTMFGHVSVHLTRCAPDHFELIVLRGFGQSLWDEIADLSVDLR